MPIVDENVTNRWVLPQGIVCDAYDNIYVAMRLLGENNTGHIHKYSSTGEFLGCIVKGLYSLQDMEITTDGSLIVANWNSILIIS